jgi:hypothetical protein
MALDDDSAMLSIDFLAGFTIFLLALIVAAAMVPGMLAGLQSATIDDDGVAYRTSVILAEDPGWFEDPNGGIGTSWESKPDESIQRIGLAVSKETPNILSSAKIERFFNQTHYENDPAFYRKTVFFSDYPYSFNISLNLTEGGTPRTLGEPLPEGDYGYIRRAAMVKEASSACLNFSDSSVLTAYTDGSTAPGPTSTFSVRLMDFNELKKDTQAYRIDPFELEEEIKITLDNLNKTGNTTATNTSLQSVKLKHGASPVPIILPNDHSILHVDGNKSQTPVNVSNNITFVLEPGFFSGINYREGLTVEFNFKNSQNQNTNITGTFDYVLTDKGNVTVPVLKPAVLEVAVW